MSAWPRLADGPKHAISVRDRKRHKIALQRRLSLQNETFHPMPYTTIEPVRDQMKSRLLAGCRRHDRSLPGDDGLDTPGRQPILHQAARSHRTGVAYPRLGISSHGAQVLRQTRRAERDGDVIEDRGRGTSPIGMTSEGTDGLAPLALPFFPPSRPAFNEKSQHIFHLDDV